MLARLLFFFSFRKVSILNNVSNEVTFKLSMWYQKIEVQTLWKKGNSSDHSDSALIDCNMYLYMYTYGIYIYILYI